MYKGCTDLEVHDIEFEWTIKKFSYQLKWPSAKNRILKSPRFTVGVENKSTWGLDMHFHSTNSSEKDDIGLFMSLETQMNMPGIVASQKYFFVDSKGARIMIRDTVAHQFTEKEGDWGFKNFYKKDKLLKCADIYLPNDSLTIICQYRVMENSVTSSAAKFTIPDTPKNELGNDFMALLGREEFFDITFLLCDGEIKAHKIILSARSPVFGAMFKHEMKEKNENIVKIDDIKKEVFEKMLQFIYTNDVSDIKEVAIDLLKAANKYQLERLVLICSKAIFENLTYENAAEILILADLYDNEPLMTATIEYIYMNIADVVKTNGYGSMAKSHPHLPAKILEALAKRN